MMQQVDNLSNESVQSTKVVLGDGTVLELVLRYNPAVQRWILDVSREPFQARGLNLCVHPNLLRQWRNVIPFGLACSTTDGGDPVYIDDFLNGRASLFVLDAVEARGVEENVFVNPL